LLPSSCRSTASPYTTLFRSDAAMHLPDSIWSYARASLERLVAIPSVSAEGRGMSEAADAVRALLVDLGFDAELHATDGAPVVLRSEEHTSELQSRENLVCRL